MSTNIDEMANSLIDKQKQQIEDLTTRLERAHRRIQHYEQVVRILQDDRKNYQAIEMEKIKATADFMTRECKYVTTIKTLTTENSKLQQQANHEKEEMKVQLRPIHLTPSYSSIQKRELDVLHIERSIFSPKGRR
jgi:hypothetical protein